MAIQKLRELLWADGVVIPRDGSGHEVVTTGSPPAQTVTVPAGGVGFNTAAFNSFGRSWAAIGATSAGGGTLTACTISASENGTTWGSAPGPLNQNGVFQASISSGVVVWVPINGQTFFRVNGTSDAANAITLTVTVGDGPVFLPLAAGGTSVASAIYGLSGASSVAITAAANTIDNVAIGTLLSLRSQSIMYGMNGTSLDRWRNNVAATDLTIAAGVGNQTVNVTNFNGVRLRTVLNVTAGAAGAGVQLQVQGKDASGVTYNLHTALAALVAAGTQVIDFYPGANTAAAAAGINQKNDVMLPRALVLNILADGVTAYTYTLTHELGVG